MQRKLGKATDQRLALLKNQVSYLLWNGKIETTLARAKEVQKLAEKNLTLAINTYQDVVKVQKTKVVNGKETKVDVINDGPKKLAARRKLISNLVDIQETKGQKESLQSENKGHQDAFDRKDFQRLRSQIRRALRTNRSEGRLYHHSQAGYASRRCCGNGNHRSIAHLNYCMKKQRVRRAVFIFRETMEK